MKKQAAASKIKKEKKYVINFGKFHEHVQFGKEIKKLHELTEKERKLLIEDFRKAKQIEKEEGTELAAIKLFEKKLQKLIENVVYLEGYIQQIEQGNPMLKINTSVKELGNELVKNTKEVEKLSGSMLKEERKMLGLAKHIKKLLDKAKRFQDIIFG